MFRDPGMEDVSLVVKDVEGSSPADALKELPSLHHSTSSM